MLPLAISVNFILHSLSLVLSIILNLCILSKLPIRSASIYSTDKKNLEKSHNFIFCQDKKDDYFEITSNSF